MDFLISKCSNQSRNHKPKTLLTALNPFWMGPKCDLNLILAMEVTKWIQKSIRWLLQQLQLTIKSTVLIQVVLRIQKTFLSNRCITSFNNNTQMYSTWLSQFPQSYWAIPRSFSSIGRCNKTKIITLSLRTYLHLDPVRSMKEKEIC